MAAFEQFQQDVLKERVIDHADDPPERTLAATVIGTVRVQAAAAG